MTSAPVRKKASEPRPRRATAALLEQHRLHLWASLAALARQPVGTLLTVAVLAIALALPAGLYLLLANLQDMSESWERVGEVSLFLAADVSSDAVAALSEELEGRADVAAVRFIAPDQALAELEQRGEYGQALEALEDNPLPAVLALSPAEGLDQAAVEALREHAAGLPGVQMAQFDMAWLIRFNALLQAGRRLVQFIAALLILGVILIVGNTIRLEIERRREEIEITKMLGGTDGFIRRPFLYTGFWLGILGGSLAWIVVLVATGVLAGPVAELARAYEGTRGISFLSARESVALVGAAGLLGWLGAWVATTRHLADVEIHRG